MLRFSRLIRRHITMTVVPPKSPLIAVIGATGTGKSQLAVGIAKRFNGEVINADSMQLYSGLPIITNKISTAEMQGVPHHLLGCIGLSDASWVVGTFVKKAMKIIEEIRSRGRIPVVVGGTHYYLQSLLFRDRLADAEDEGKDEAWIEDKEDTYPILRENTSVLLEELRKRDPIMADRWHPNDRRKIQRSLEIALHTGRSASDLYAEQRQGDASESLRCPTLLFWLHAENATLRSRLDARVDKMLEAGLLDEVRALSSFAAEQQTPVDESRGIWVSIGFKEFKDYIHAFESGTVGEKELARMKADALEKTKAATRQYAKRQIRWIRIKLLNSLSAAQATKSLYLLDGTDLTSFSTSAIGPALSLTSAFLAGQEMPDPSSLSGTAARMLTPQRDYDLAATPEKWTRQHCEICGVTCVTMEQWEKHVGSKGHRALVRRQKKAQEMANGDWIEKRNGDAEG